MSNDEYQHQDFWKAVKKQFDMMNPVCIKKGENGECLISAQWITLDFKDKTKQEKHANKNI